LTGKESALEMLILIIGLLVLDIASLRWGISSIEPPGDPERVR
jgi:hypothetical protein